MVVESQVRMQLLERGELSVSRAQQRVEVAKPKTIEEGETLPRKTEMVGWCRPGLLRVVILTEGVCQPNALIPMLVYGQNYPLCFLSLTGQWIDSLSSLVAVLWEVPP